MEGFRKTVDAAGSLGYGTGFGSKWFYSKWVDINMQEFSITVKELFPIAVAIEIWGYNLSNCSIMFFSDNLAVVHIINKMSSKDSVVLSLVRRLVLLNLPHIWTGTIIPPCIFDRNSI